MAYRKLPQRLPGHYVPALTDALLTARRRVLEASTVVPWGCATDHALRSIVAAIDALRAMLKHLSGDLWDMDSDLSAALRSSDRARRPITLENPFPLLGDLRTLRDALRSAQDHVAVDGAVYQALQMVDATIMGLTVLLTGDETYFHPMGGGTTDGQRAAEARKLARERGEIVPSDGRDFGLKGWQ